jgi:RNA polymerase sigma-70 factor, ECF subfamily
VSVERFDELFASNFRAVSAYALRRAPRADAEEVVAETFLVAWRRLDDVPANARPWLLGVARRMLANQRRAAKRRGALEERIGQARASEPPRSRPIREALRELRAKDRELVLLVAWDGLSVAEAAAVLGCSRTAAKVRLHRARRRLRDELGRLERAEARPLPRAQTGGTT